MDWSWSQEDQEFREEIRTFLNKELPPNWIQEYGDEDDPRRGTFEQQFAKKLGAKGWLACGWPQEYGGMGWSVVQQMLFNEELALVKAPRRYMSTGITHVGPSLIIHGTEQQRQTFLPPIAKADVVWCQLFSEPDAGSDLASLKTTAQDQGDYFLLNGQKTWTSMGHMAQWGILLARTDPDLPRHRGISYFLLDLSLPGITARPIVNMADVHHFNEYFFDNVRVPKDALVGEVNQGWKVTTSTLNFERSGIRATVPAVQLFGELLDVAKNGANGFKPLKNNPILRHRIADMAIRLQVSRDLSYRVGWMQSDGQNPASEGSIARIFAAEVTQQLVELGMEILGHWAEPTHDSPTSVLRGKVQKLYRGQRAITIGTGTSEIQRTGIAVRGLGLPRG